MNIPSSSVWQPARKRKMIEERVVALALPWNLLPALLRRRPNRILSNRQHTDTRGCEGSINYLELRNFQFIYIALTSLLCWLEQEVFAH